MIKQVISPLGIASLSALLKQVQLELDGEELAELLWLAVQMGEVEVTDTTETPVKETQIEIEETEIEETTDSPVTPPPANIESRQPPLANTEFRQPSAPAYLPSSSDVDTVVDQPQSKPAPEGIPFKAPAAPGLRNPLTLARALRPLMRKVSSQTKKILDEEETLTQFAEKRILIPVLKPAPERWLDLAFVVEESRSIVIWQEIIAEFQKLTELQGAFRSVSTWSLQTDEKGEIKLFPKQNQTANKQRSRSPKELLDPAGRRLVLLISDCTSGIWHQGKIHDLLKLWSNFGPLAIVQLLPERLWMRTAMGNGFPVQLNALAPGIPNTKLAVDGLPVWEDVDVKKAIILPVVTLEADSLQQWSRVVAGVGSTQTAGILFEPSLIPAQPQISKDATQLSATELVNRFRATASPMARRLAGLMATVPVSLPVVHLIQETLLKDSMQVHVAEVFMSGLLQSTTINSTASKGEIVNYKFVEGVRELLIGSVPTPDVDTVLEVVSQYIARRVGLSIKNFAALLSPNTDWDKTAQQEIIPFAEIATQVLRRLGGEYAALAEQLERKSQVIPKPLEVSNNLPQLLTFEFEVATIELKKSLFGLGEIEPTVKRSPGQAQCFIEDLGNGVQLEMVSIPEGSFMMGSPRDEKDRSNSESPQHEVIVQPFFLGKFSVTQAQWQAVASLPQINRKLKPNPSRFKGANLPVEQVSWYDAVEFCDRLSQYTGKPYRLPSEAEWEYACRAGTTTPFHFGETIISEVANYDANYTYGADVKGEYRQQTTPVGNFGVANAFGLYDMHGNVWEWCLDHWHNNYEGAPTDGSPWFDNNDNFYQKQGRAVLRGGSWTDDPKNCRSAYRSNIGRAQRDDILNNDGFRVACSVGRILK